MNAGVNALPTVIWLEGKKLWGWAAFLGGLLALAAFAVWRIRRDAVGVPVSELGESFGLMTGLLFLAGVAGFLLWLIAIGRIGQAEGLLFLSVPSGQTHTLGRFLFTVGVFGAFQFLLAALFWWGLGLLEVRMSLLGVWSLTLYTFIFTLPLFALSFLSRHVGLAYGLSRLTWLSILVGVLGTFAALGWLFELSARTAYTFLPVWGFPSATAFGQNLWETLPVPGLPTEPVLYALLVTGLFLWLAGRVWEEVEA